MKYGIREICDVVLKAKGKMNIGNKVFYKDEPVIYFDSLKTSTLEGASTTAYAQGGRGNARLLAWEGERTVTFTMEDALISSVGLAILAGANILDAADGKPVIQHVTETVEWEPAGNGITAGFYVSEKPHQVGNEHMIYLMKIENGAIVSEPYICTGATSATTIRNKTKYLLSPAKKATVSGAAEGSYTATDFPASGVAFVDYYTARTSGAQQIEITPETFGGNFYLEASTLFRNEDGIDMPAEFVIPNCKIQSNFTFSMASSGDPSTFTFTMDAFPDYTRFDQTKKVISVIQIITEDVGTNSYRVATDGSVSSDKNLDNDDPHDDVE